MAAENSTDHLIRSLADKFSTALSGIIAPDQPYALLDFPDHPNVGDSAIYTGEMVFLEPYMKRSPSYVCTIENYARDIDRFCPDGPILLHGGGNFGTVWPKHQHFRHEILERYPDRQVVQLPQSIHFSDDATREATARAIGAHKNFTLLVRDLPSFELAQKQFDCTTVMCPDAAYNMLHLPPTAPAQHPVLSILRRDPEKVENDIRPYLESLGPIDDWGRHFWARSLTDRVVERYIAPQMRGSRMLMARRERMYLRQAWNRVHYGVELLQRGERLVSDRLHVHIMAGLMRREHVALDNFYGKISNFIEAWGEDGLVKRANDLTSLKAALAE